MKREYENPTIETLGPCDYELRCDCPAGGEDVSINPDTGICSECGKKWDIVEVDFIFEDIDITSPDFNPDN